MLSRPLLCGLGLGLGVGLDTYGLGLGLGLEGLVSDIFKTSTLYEYLFFFGIFHRKKTTVTEIVRCIYLCGKCSSC